MAIDCILCTSGIPTTPSNRQSYQVYRSYLMDPDRWSIMTTRKQCGGLSGLLECRSRRRSKHGSEAKYRVQLSFWRWKSTKEQAYAQTASQVLNGMQVIRLAREMQATMVPECYQLVEPGLTIHRTETNEKRGNSHEDAAG